MIGFLLGLESSDNEYGHQVDERLVLQLIELMVNETIFIVLKVKALLIHRYAPKHRIEALNQSNWSGLNQQFLTEQGLEY